MAVILQTKDLSPIFYIQISQWVLLLTQKYVKREEFSLLTISCRIYFLPLRIEWLRKNWFFLEKNIITEKNVTVTSYLSYINISIIKKKKTVTPIYCLWFTKQVNKCCLSYFQSRRIQQSKQFWLLSFIKEWTEIQMR